MIAIPLSDSPGKREHVPYVMLTLLLANVLVFVYELSLPSDALEQLFLQAGAVPAEIVHGQITAPPPFGVPLLTLVTSMFVHDGWLHIGGNMLYLWIFGDNVEDKFGHLQFLVFYFICGLAAGLAQVFIDTTSTVPSIGASGAIAGVLAAYLLLFPHASVRTLLFIGPFFTFTRLSAIVVIGLWFVLQLLASLLSFTSLGAQSQQSGGVATWAHVGGFVVGLVLTQLIFRPRERTATFTGSY